MQTLINEGNNNLFEKLKTILDTKIDTITTSMNQNIEATNENTKKSFALKEQVASLEETNSLQSSQLEEIRSAQHEAEKHFIKRIQELESSLSQQSSLINSQKLEIATTNSTLTETIKDF